MSRQQFSEIMKQFYPDMDTSKVAGHFFRMCDGGSDSKIEFQEFVTSLLLCTGGSVRDKLTHIFRTMDINGDGSIAQKDLIRKVKDLANFGHSEAMELVAPKDLNHDGKITYSEFIVLNEDKFSWLMDAFEGLSKRPSKVVRLTAR